MGGFIGGFLGSVIGAHADVSGLRYAQCALCGTQWNVTRASCLAWGLGWADAAEVDEFNVLQATFLAMRRALAALRSVFGPHELGLR